MSAATRGLRGLGGNKDVTAWLRKIAKMDGIGVARSGERNCHWEISLHGKVVSTVAATGNRNALTNAKGALARKGQA